MPLRRLNFWPRALLDKGFLVHTGLPRHLHEPLVAYRPGSQDGYVVGYVFSAAAQVARAVGNRRSSLMLQLPDGTAVRLPRALVEVLRASADELADGHAVTVLPSEVALSPAEAAELLGLSRPFVVRLLDEGEIPSDLNPRVDRSG